MELLPTIILSILGSASFVAVISYLLFRRKHRAETALLEENVHKSETENAAAEIDILEKAKQAAIDAFNSQKELDAEKRAHDRDNANNEFLIKLAEKENSRLDAKIDKIRGEFTEMQINEKNCREELADLRQFKEDQVKVNEKLVDYSDRNAVLTALVKKAHERGYLTGPELTKADVV